MCVCKIITDSQAIQRMYKVTQKKVVIIVLMSLVLLLYKRIVWMQVCTNGIACPAHRPRIMCSRSVGQPD